MNSSDRVMRKDLLSKEISPRRGSFYQGVDPVKINLITGANPIRGQSR